MSPLSLSTINRSLALFFISMLLIAPLHAEKLTYWQQSNAASTAVIDHSAWQVMLNKYLTGRQLNVEMQSSQPSVNLFAYKAVSSQDKLVLEDYLQMLQQLDPRLYNSAVQQAYWINLYNALTVNLILDNYPTSSITKLGDKFFAFGPWDDVAAKINGKKLTLNDIEHKILRPIWQDPRIHYAVNCASYSCPNLSKTAYTGENLEQQLEQGAKQYINHPRGVAVTNGDLVISKIYKWYAEDFGNNEQDLIKHLQQYATPALKQQLDLFLAEQGDIDYEYDWRLNQSK